MSRKFMALIAAIREFFFPSPPPPPEPRPINYYELEPYLPLLNGLRLLWVKYPPHLLPKDDQEDYEYLVIELCRLLAPERRPSHSILTENDFYLDLFKWYTPEHVDTLTANMREAYHLSNPPTCEEIDHVLNYYDEILSDSMHEYLADQGSLILGYHAKPDTPSEAERKVREMHQEYHQRKDKEEKQYEREYKEWVRYKNKREKGNATSYDYVPYPDEPDDTPLYIPVPLRDAITLASSPAYPLPLYTTQSERVEHMYVLGKTGSGKTNFLLTLMRQDLQRFDTGLIVFSPQQDIYKFLLRYLPDERKDDLIYFNPADSTPPIIGFNPFSLEDGDDLYERAGEVSAAFKRSFSKDLGATMDVLFDETVTALLQLPNATLKDFRTLIDPSDDTLRRRILSLSHISEHSRQFWEEYDSASDSAKYYRRSYPSVYNKIRPFLSPPHVTTLSTASFSWHKELNSYSRIIFCDMSKAGTGRGELLGQLLLAQIQLTIFRRDSQERNLDVPYYLYLDEFQSFAKYAADTLQLLSTQVRKYHVGMIASNQVLRDIPEGLRENLTGNVGATVALKLAPSDAPVIARNMLLKDEKGNLRPDKLQRLRKGYAVVVTYNHDTGTTITVPNLSQPLTRVDTERFEAMRMHSKQQYGITPTDSPTEHAASIPAQSGAPQSTPVILTADNEPLIIDRTKAKPKRAK